MRPAAGGGQPPLAGLGHLELPVGVVLGRDAVAGGLDQEDGEVRLPLEDELHFTRRAVHFQVGHRGHATRGDAERAVHAHRHFLVGNTLTGDEHDLEALLGELDPVVRPFSDLFERLPERGVRAVDFERAGRVRPRPVDVDVRLPLELVESLVEGDVRLFQREGTPPRSKVLRRGPMALQTQPRSSFKGACELSKSKHESPRFRRSDGSNGDLLPAELEEGRSPGRCRSGDRKTPAITYSRVLHTTIGPGCLTAVFGMGTGVTIQVSSPESSV